MQNNIKKPLLKAILTISFVILSGCARDLSSNVYTSESTLSMTLEGTILATRPVIIKNEDKLSDNTTGILAGGAAGGVLGSTAGRGSGNTAMVVGGILAGSAIGSVIESSLGQANGFEYVVKVDTNQLKTDTYPASLAMRNAISSAATNGLITVVQGKDVVLSEGQNVYIIFSPKRTRIIAKK